MEKLVAYFFNGYRSGFQTGWFKRGLYVFVLLKAANWLAYFDLYFGPESIVYTRPFVPHGLAAPAFFLYGQASPALAYGFIGALMALSLLGLIRPRIYFLPDFLIWLLVINLHSCVYSTLTGGDYLLNQFLFFNCFLAAPAPVRPGWPGALKVSLHNFAVIALMLQVCLVYLLSALAKCNDPAWLSGQAVSSIAQLQQYSPGHTYFDTGLLPVVLTYLVLGYQLLFPVLVWFGSIKKLLITAGILMHLYIALIIGLPGFGAIMILAYIYFWPFKKQMA